MLAMAHSWMRGRRYGIGAPATWAARRAVLTPRRHRQHRIEGGLGLALAVEQQGVVGSVRDRIAVLPRHAVFNAPDRHPVQFVAARVEDAEQLGVTLGQLLLHLVGQAVAV